MDPKIKALLDQYMASRDGGAGGLLSLGQPAGPSPLGAPGAPPGPGGVNPFGPAPGAAQPPSALTSAGSPPQAGQPPQAGANPMLQGVGMTLEQAAYGGQERDLDRQAKIADELRNAATPGMRGGSGRVQTAANPLEMLSTGLDRFRGNQQEGNVAADRNLMFEERMRKLREAANGGM
jgi:hypothetical protein